MLVEDASRFARDLVTQGLGIIALPKLGVRVLTANGDDLTVTDDPMKKAMRQIAGVFAELEKTRLVHKLRVARERRKVEKGKCEGRKSHGEKRPEVVALARQIKARGGLRMSLRAMAAELEAAGHVIEKGKRFNANSIRKMLAE